MEQAAIAYLEKDRLLHMDMLEPLRLGEAKVVYAGEDGVLIHHTDDIYMLSAATEESVARIMAPIESASLLVLHAPFLREEVLRRYSLHHTMPCHQAAWLKDGPVPNAPEGADIRILTAADLGTVLKHYTNIQSEEYIRGRLHAGMLGAYVDGKLAGFIGTHPEGTIGLLEVLPAYRRRGLAFVLESAMMQRQQLLGRIPYAQIKEGNEASIALHRKLGMEITPDAQVCWLY